MTVNELYECLINPLVPEFICDALEPFTMTEINTALFWAMCAMLLWVLFLIICDLPRRRR